MRRRKLVATAGALSVTAFAATLAIGANFGLASQAASNSPVGRLDAHHQDAHHRDAQHQDARPTVVGAAVANTPPAVAVTTPALGPHADD